MGMDVYGWKNSEAYFRANVWGWRPLHCLIVEANKRFRLGIQEKTLIGMSFNEGAGVKSHKRCIRLAESLEKLIAENSEEVFRFDSEPIGVEGAFLKAVRPLEWENAPLYEISKDHVREFIEFLYVCGGFEVW